MVESMPQIDMCYIPDDKHITLTPPSLPPAGSCA